MHARKTAPPVVALADDLSGAAEVAALLRQPTLLRLHPSATTAPPDGEAVVVDLDSRQLPGTAAADAVRTALAAHAGSGSEADSGATTWYKKCDSLLRGNVGAEAGAFAEGARALVIATALPVGGRTVRDGVLRIGGVPLHETDAWRAEEGCAPPRSVAQAFAPLPTAVVPLDVVRREPRRLAERLAELAGRGLHPVCDAETDADLDAVAAAALQLGTGIRLLGSGGLAAALGRILGTGMPEPPAATAGRPLLVVAGSAEPGLVAQIAHLEKDGAQHLPLHPDTLAARDRSPVPLPPLDPHGVTVLSIDGSGGVRPEAARELVAGLARTAAALPHAPDLVLTGGETARRVLDAMRITALRPVAEIHHGAVHSRTADGRSVVTRPGSFGDADSLGRIVDALRPAHA
ncbi:four-carbon acid sugar kinase family protein [Streptomyces sp. NPDC006422]|uniref:four-carbon acid sugar kinase family protein n=1 Tax=unclassified Streptomyces TaxID=2593676 RepID=UPI0033BF393A